MQIREYWSTDLHRSILRLYASIVSVSVYGTPYLQCEPPKLLNFDSADLDPDPDHAFDFDADPDPTFFYSLRIRIRLLEMMRIWIRNTGYNYQVIT
jgi:hypothetical protein